MNDSLKRIDKRIKAGGKEKMDGIQSILQKNLEAAR